MRSRPPSRSSRGGTTRRPRRWLPSPEARATMAPPALPRTLLIACGALAREVLALIRLNGWTHMEVACLPANLHNTPQRIPEAVRTKIHAAQGRYDKILV